MKPTLSSLIAEVVPAWLLPLDAASNPGRPEDTPMPAPTWKPEIKEPEDVDELPDEAPLPNPDENRDPPKHVAATPPQPFPPVPDPQPDPAPGPSPVPTPKPF